MHGSKRIRVVIIDDHPMYREGVAQAIRSHAELQLVGEAG
jgi:DNA-binding NarL/FixJ family response regulator